jgi:TIR domain-containing protein
MNVFISHSSHDKWIARQISRMLEAEGHKTFLDEKDIKSGDSIDHSIQLHLKESDHLLILLSPASINSHWVFIELGGAKALGKKVVPILLHLGANEIPAPIAQLLARDINDFDKYLAELRSPDGKPATKKAASPRSRRTRRRVPVFTGQDGPTLSHTRFVIGDKVRIAQVEHLTDHDKSTLPVWVTEMDKYSGAETQVIEVFQHEGWLQLAVDEGNWYWAPSWVSKVG